MLDGPAGKVVEFAPRITVTGLAQEETAVYPPIKRAGMGKETAVAGWRGLSRVKVVQSI